MRSFPLLVASTLTLCVACTPAKPQGEALGEALYDNCVTCHGDDGSGDPLYLAPAIAGLSEWYVRTELEKFRDQIRGAHPDDEGGLRMGPMTQIFQDEGDLEAVASYVAGMAPTNPASTIGDAEDETAGDATRGQALFTPCIECHGARAEGIEAQGGPALTGASDWYLLTQLKNFKAGVRGADPRDTNGIRMAAMVAGLADEQAMKDVIAYIGTLGD